MANETQTNGAAPAGETETLNPQAKALVDKLNAAAASQTAKPTTQAEQIKAARDGYRQTIPLAGEPEPVHHVWERDLPGANGPIPVRLYAPSEAASLPVVVYCHGGGFITGDFDTHDAPLRALCNRSGCLIVSAGYRLAPESPWPAAPEDCYAVTKWLAENGGEIGADGSRIAVAGDSAGGALAAVVCLMARDRGGPHLRYQVLLYPDTDLTESSASWQTFAHTIQAIVSIDFKRMGIGLYVPNGESLTNPYVSPLHARDLSDLPPALVITAGVDPQRDEGEAYARRLQEAGVVVEQTRYSGTPHGFFAFAGVLDASKQVLEQVGQAIRAALQPNA